MSGEYGYHGEKLTTITNEECEEIMEDIIDGVDPESRYLTEEEKIALKKKLVYEHSIYPNEDSLDSIMTTDDITFDSQKFKHILTISDTDLLIEYAPKLFNTTPNPTNIRKDMYNLVNLVYEYRINSSSAYGVNVIIDNYPRVNAKKNKNDKEKSLVDNIEKILEAMGGDLLSTEKAFDLKKQLRDVCKHPALYIPNKPHKPKADKGVIKNYLFELNLKNKTKTIEAFITAIK